MSKAADKDKAELPVEAMLLEAKRDRYKLGYSAIRWAKELKQKENLAEAIQFLVPRALREILTNKVSYKEIEKLPILAKVVTPPAAPAVPTLTLNVAPSDETEEKEKGKSKEKD